MKKFYIHTMGCKSNQFESSIIAENLEKNGVLNTQDIKDANYYILNSCTVTHKSDNEAMYLLRAAKHKNPNIITILTGCIAQVEKEKLLDNEFVDMVIGNDEKLNLYKILEELENSSNKCIAGDIMHQTKFNEVVLEDMTKTRASVKIQDGCDNRCSYCIIPFARGKSRSADTEFIIEQINNFSKHGFKEVVLTGIHIGLWGKENNLSLLDLLKEIELKTSIERYRLGSLNPHEITDEMLEFLSKSKKFCPHFHLSLQSACNKTLRSMNRFYTVEEYLEQIDKINSMFDLPFIGSDIIAGFAGETKNDFHTTVDNLQKSGLTKIHVFPYSIRKGTQGAIEENQLDEKTKTIRADIIKAVSFLKYTEFVKKNINQEQEILIEKHFDKKSGMLKGVTRNYLTVLINSNNENLFNTLQTVKIEKFENGKIYGNLI